MKILHVLAAFVGCLCAGAPASPAKPHIWVPHLLKIQTPKGSLVYDVGPDVDISGYSGAGRASGKLVFAGYGIQAKRDNHDDLAGLDVKGRVVLLLDGYPGESATSPLAHLQSVVAKAAMLRKLGATAVIVTVTKADFKKGTSAERYSGSHASLPVLRVRSTVAEQWIRESTHGDLPTIWENADVGKHVSMPLKASASVLIEK